LSEIRPLQTVNFEQSTLDGFYSANLPFSSHFIRRLTFIRQIPHLFSTITLFTILQNTLFHTQYPI
jgi:hypothetical protein